MSNDTRVADSPQLDEARARRGMAQVSVEGAVTASRLPLIEEAIARIQRDGRTALLKEYLGIKNYASFGDQREDHTYGYGPRHGSIVFRIGRSESPCFFGGTLDADAIYFLEAVRDFGTREVPEARLLAAYAATAPHYERPAPRLNLQDVLRAITPARQCADGLDKLLRSASVESHVLVSDVDGRS